MRSQSLQLATLSGLVALSGWLPTAQAWGAAGHEIVATIAQIHLHPSVLPTICALLDIDVDASDDTSSLRAKCHLSSIATWADKEKMKIRWSAAMHYVGAVDDFPRERCEFPGPKGWAGTRSINVLDATKNVTRILAEWGGVDENEFSLVSPVTSYVPPYGSRSQVPGKRVKQLPVPGPLQEEAFKFLVHFVGDMHQPLHLTGRARGGNGIKIHFGTRTTNLHSAWDTMIPTKLIRTVPRNYTRPLPDLSLLSEPSLSSPYFSLRGPVDLAQLILEEDDYPGYIPPSSAQIESALRGTIYDALIRRIMWEGVRGKWGVPSTHQGEDGEERYSEIDTWGLCPLNNTVPAFQSSIIALDDSQAAFGLKEPTPIDPDGPLICPYAWTAPIHTLNCDYIWPADIELTESFDSDDEHDHDHDDLLLSEEFTEYSRPPHRGNPSPRPSLPDLDVPSYMGPLEREMIVEKLMAQGGLRLAGILNWLFADWEE